MLDPLDNWQEKVKHGENKVQKGIGMSGKQRIDKMFSLIEIWTILKLVKCNISKDNFNLEQNTIQKKNFKLVKLIHNETLL